MKLTNDENPMTPEQRKLSSISNTASIILDMAAPLVALAQAGVPTDIQGLLIDGDPARGIAPGALDKAITAYLTATVPADVAALVERLRAHGDNPFLPGSERKAFNEAATALEALASRPSPNETMERRFEIGHRVTKIKGSSWTGRIVGFYATALTPIGYCVESENEPGSVQIYPEAAIRAMKEPENG